MKNIRKVSNIALILKKLMFSVLIPPINSIVESEDALFDKVGELRLNKLEIKKEKGEKFENNVGMKIFLPKSLAYC